MIHIVIRHAAVIAPHLVFRFKSAEALLNQATDSILSLKVCEMATKLLIIGKNIITFGNRQSILKYANKVLSFYY